LAWPGYRATGRPSCKHSVAIHGEMAFDADRLLLSWKSASRLPAAPLVKSCEWDFFRRERTQNHNVPGPFLGLENPVTLQLRNGLAAESR
jgi:hypothetical protein